MAGKVFISCGQWPPREKSIAEKVASLLDKEFKLNPYLSFRIQTLEDVMTITDELSSSDYFLFIDFLREAETEKIQLPISLYSHQELALARHLGFKNNIIALKEKGTPNEGFIKYVLSNPEEFDSEEDLLGKIRSLIKERGWDPDYSRNLVVSGLSPTYPWEYRDHIMCTFECVWQIKVNNRRPDVASIGTVCVLDCIKDKEGNND